MTLDSYGQQRAEELRKWQARKKKKEDMNLIASTMLVEFNSTVVEGQKPKGARDRWVKDNPELALKYIDAIMRMGRYWDTMNLKRSVDDIAEGNTR